MDSAYLFGNAQSLDGVKYALAGEFAIKVIGEPIKRSFVAYYIDPRERGRERGAT